MLRTLPPIKVKNKPTTDAAPDWKLWEPYPIQQKLLDCDASLVGFGGSGGGSKEQCAILDGYRKRYVLEFDRMPLDSEIPSEILKLETKVLTPSGWVYLSDIKIGDIIQNPDGTSQRVLDVIERGEQDLYRFTFNDGTSTLAGKDHLWAFWDADHNSKVKSHRKNGGGIRPLTGNWNQDYIVRARIENTLTLKSYLDNGRHILTPICAPQRFTRGSGKGKVMNPYLLGVLIGDGSLTNEGLTFCKPIEDGAIAQRLKSDSLKVRLMPIEPKADGYKPIGRWRICEPAQLDAMKSYGLMGTKSHQRFIPPWYLWAPLEIRWALAQGLMDTDGSVGQEGRHVSYSTTSKQLSDDSAHLFRSLGFRVSIAERESSYVNPEGEKIECRNVFVLAIQGHDTSQLFSLPRKKDRCIPFNGGVSWPARRIESIEFERRANARCLRVSNPNHLYITDDFIVTHNSTAILFAAFLKHKKSLILRKTYPNLKEIIERSRELFHGSGGKYNSIDKMWRFPDGKNIEMGALQYEQEKDNYRGREHSGLFVDEVTELPGGWATLQFLMGWMRSPDINQKCQCVITFNPPSTPEGEWIKEVFAAWIDPFHDNPAESGEIRWFANIDGKDIEVEQTEPYTLNGELIEPMSRTFIRATLEDNLRLKDTTYRQTLKSLPEPLRSQLLYGDMSLSMDDDAWQVIPSAWVEKAFERWENSCPLPTSLSCIGVDVARGGRDQTIIAGRRGNWFEELKAYPGKSTPDGGAVAAQVAKHWEEGCGINIDVVGVGTSVYDILKDTYSKVQAIGGGEKSHKSDRSSKLSFFNKRSEIIWLLREALDPETGAHLAFSRSPKLKAELCAAHWSLVPPIAGDESKKGRIKVEGKDEIIKRIGRSPDRADAIAYCWANQLDEFEPIEYGLEVRDIAPKVPQADAAPQFTVKRRGRGGWR